VWITAGDGAGDVQQTGILVDIDVANRAVLDRPVVLVDTVAPALAGTVRLRGRDDHLARHLIGQPLEIGQLAVADVQEIGVEVGRGAIRQRHTGEVARDRGGQLQ
jgi:hypothetical protein